MLPLEKDRKELMPGGLWQGEKNGRLERRQGAYLRVALMP